MKALTLQEAKDKISRDKFTCKFDGLPEYLKMGVMHEAALLHSLSCQEALREKIASEAGFTFIFPGGIPSIDREAIRNTPLIEG